MSILAIDYGSQMGWCIGRRGEPQPLSGVHHLELGVNEGAGLYRAWSFLRALQEHARKEGIGITDVLFEQRLVGHVRTGRNAQIHLLGVCAIIQAQAHAWSARVHEVPVQKVRAWLLPDLAREERTKDAVRKRLHEAGALQSIGVPLDRSDAVALWAWHANPDLLHQGGRSLPLLDTGDA